MAVVIDYKKSQSPSLVIQDFTVACLAGGVSRAVILLAPTPPTFIQVLTFHQSLNRVQVLLWVLWLCICVIFLLDLPYLLFSVTFWIQVSLTLFDPR